MKGKTYVARAKALYGLSHSNYDEMYQLKSRLHELKQRERTVRYAKFLGVWLFDSAEPIYPESMTEALVDHEISSFYWRDYGCAPFAKIVFERRIRTDGSCERIFHIVSDRFELGKWEECENGLKYVPSDREGEGEPHCIASSKKRTNELIEEYGKIALLTDDEKKSFYESCLEFAFSIAWKGENVKDKINESEWFGKHFFNKF